MKSKRTITILMAALICLALSGMALAQEYEGKGNEFGMTVDRSSVAAPSERLDPDANWLAISALPNEADLVDTYDYQLKQAGRMSIGHGHMNVDADAKKDSQPCYLTKNRHLEKCREWIGG